MIGEKGNFEEQEELKIKEEQERIKENKESEKQEVRYNKEQYDETEEPKEKSTSNFRVLQRFIRTNSKQKVHNFFKFKIRS